MKLFGREAKTSDDKEEIKGGGAIEDSRPNDQEREEAGCSKKDAVEGDRISTRTATTATPSESHRSSSSKPVDLDDLYDNGNFDDTSDASVGDVTETSISHSHSDSRCAGGEAASAGQHEDNRMAALVHTMAEKQEGISDAFYHMIKKLTKSVQQMEQQQQDDAADEKAKSRAKRHVEKALEMQEAAKTMATKQTRIAQQFVALVHRLEHESAELAAANQGLRRQLQTARVILKDEAGVELEDVSTTQHSHATPTHKSGAPRNPQTPRSSSGSHNNNNIKSKRPPLTQHHSRSSRSAHSSPASTIHPIKEICFSNTVVDVTELMSTSALNNSSSEDAADPSCSMTTPIKESTSSDSPGATSESSPRTVANTDNLRFLL